MEIEPLDKMETFSDGANLLQQEEAADVSVEMKREPLK